MQGSNFPLSLAQWKRYFDMTFQFIDEIVPTISFGLNKVDLIITNLQAFRKSFLTDHQSSVPLRESRVLFEFFKTCAAFISYSSQYNSKKMLNYILSHPVNGQYNELYELWSSWTVQSSMLLCDSFIDINLLCHAHYLDLKSLNESLGPILSTFPEPISNALSKKLNDISNILKLGTIPAEKNKSGIIQHSQIVFVKEISDEPHHNTVLARLMPFLTEVAVKELKPVELEKSEVNHLKCHLNIIRQLDHPNIIKFEGVTMSPPFCIAVRYIERGSLFEVLHGNDANKNIISPTDKLKIALDMARGLEYLDAMRIVHHDFRSKNVLLDKNNKAVISNFGISRQIGSTAELEFGAVQWAAPEVLGHNCKYTDSAMLDIFSYGIVLWELFTNHKPFADVNNQMQIAAMVTDRDIRPDIPSNISPEMTALIQSCWSYDPKERPKASEIRKKLENGSISIDDVDMTEFLKYVEESKSEHESIMEKHKGTTAAKEAKYIEILTQPNVLEQNSEFYSVQILKELQQIEYILTPKLFDVIFRLMSQNQSFPVQDEAFSMMKQILSREDLAAVIDPVKIIDKMLKIVGHQPFFVISAVKLISPKLTDIRAIVEKFVALRHSLVTLELIKAVVQQNSDRIDTQMIISIFDSLSGKLTPRYFQFILSLYGPLIEFFPSALKSPHILAIYIKELAKLCDVDFIKVRELIKIEEVSKEGKKTLKTILNSISQLIVNPKADINDKIAIIMFNFIIKSCIRYKTVKTFLPLLNTCLRMSCMRTIISRSDVWNLIIEVIATDSDNLNTALRLVERIPVTPDQTTRQNLWNTIILKYQMTRQKEITHTVCSLLKRRSDLDLAVLLPILMRGYESSDTDYCNTAIKITRHFGDDGFALIKPEPLFWKSLTTQMQKKNEVICRSIGKLVDKMIEKVQEFKFDPRFFESIVAILYDQNTSFDTAMPFIVFLGKCCKSREIVLFLQKESFVRYLQQLPWRYENEPRVSDAIEHCASSLTRYYSTSISM